MKEDLTVRKGAIITIILVLVIAPLLYWGLTGESSNSLDSGNENQIPSGGENLEVGTDVGNLAPTFTLTDIHGKTFSLEDFRNKITVLDFMSTQCGGCIAEMYYLNKVYSNYGEDEVRIISIDVNPAEEGEDIMEFKEAYGDNWIYASGPEVGIDYKLSVIPSIFILDGDGKIVYKNAGVTPYSKLSEKIDQHL